MISGLVDAAVITYALELIAIVVAMLGVAGGTVATWVMAHAASGRGAWLSKSPVMAIAVVTFGIWWAASGDAIEAMIRLVAVLVIACPHALGLTPDQINLAAGTYVGTFDYNDAEPITVQGAGPATPTPTQTSTATRTPTATSTWTSTPTSTWTPTATSSSTAPA